MTKRHSVLFACGCVAIAVLQTATAKPVFEMPGGHVIAIADLETTFGATPITIAPGITATSDPYDPGPWVGRGPAQFLDNGVWDGSVVLISVQTDLNGSDAYSVTLHFATPVAGVGGKFNYPRYDDPQSEGGLAFTGLPTITARAADGSVLEQYVLTKDDPSETSARGGAFRGFLRPTADIAEFSFANSAIALTDLTIATGSAPEPGTLYLLLTAAICGCVIRCRAIRRQAPLKGVVLGLCSTIHGKPDAPVRRDHALPLLWDNRRSHRLGLSHVRAHVATVVGWRRRTWPGGGSAFCISDR